MQNQRRASNQGFPRRLDGVTYYRKAVQVQFCELMPFLGLGGANPGQETRHGACLNVLMRLPQKDFVRLKRKADSFHWFIPDAGTLGLLHPFPPTVPERKLQTQRGKPPRTIVEMARVLYLSPYLEGELAVAIAVVAHELAHVVLNHELVTNSNRQDEAQEAQAWAKVREWGFTKEERQYKKWRKANFPE